LARKENLKLELLQIKKKVIELELSLANIEKKIKDFDFAEFSKLKDRVEDLEDLIMVDNAGIVELKKMLENLNGKIEKEVKKAVEEFKLNLSKTIHPLSEEENEKIGRLNKDVEDKLEKAQKLLSDIETVKLEIENKTKKLEEVQKLIPKLDNEVSKLYESVKDIKLEFIEMLKENNQKIRKELVEVLKEILNKNKTKNL